MNAEQAKTEIQVGRQLLLDATRTSVLDTFERHRTGDRLSGRKSAVSTHCLQKDLFWCDKRYGVFVTAYKRLPALSENVWCCMSNGDYVPKNDLLANIRSSGRICASNDPRRTAQVPIAFEVSLFAPKSLWITRRVDGSDLCRSLRRAIMVVTGGSEVHEQASAVYLPEVWDERPQWSGRELIANLAHKSGAHKGQTEEWRRDNVQAVFEIPCYNVASPSLNVNRSDRGFFATLVLKSALPFYTLFSKNNKLAYQVNDGLAAPTPIYDNGGAFVRSYADVGAYYKLHQAIEPRSVSGADKWAEKIVNHAIAKFPTKGDGHLIAARVNFLLNVDRSDLVTPQLVEALLEGFPNVEKSFAEPQIILAVCNVMLDARAQAKLTAETHRRMLSSVERFLNPEINTEKENALRKNGAFAANWLLQAFAKAKQLQKKLQLPVGVPQWVENALQLCRATVTRPTSVTIQACAAHGLLSLNQFDYVTYDWLVESWFRLQEQFDMNGGMSYYTHNASSGQEYLFRTDVTSHVVEVCLLLRNEQCDITNGHAERLALLGL